MANQLKRYELGLGAGVLSTADGGQLVIGDTTPTTTSTSMYGVASDNSGNLYICDSANATIYKVTESGYIQLFAGLAGAQGFTDGIASAARFDNPHGIAVDRSGTIYVADTNNGAVRRIDMNGNVGTLAVTTTGASAFVSPWGVACAPNGDVYVTDQAQHCVYQIKPNGTAVIWAGTYGSSGDVSAEYGSSAEFDTPTGIAVDPSGYVFVSDSGNYKVKRIGLDGFVVRFCGTAAQGDVIGTYQTSRFTSLGLMACDRSGNVYVIDGIYAGTASSSSSSQSGDEDASNGLVGDKIKKIDQNGNTSLVSMVTDGVVVGIATSPAGVVYVTRSSGTAGSSSSSVSSSSSSSVSSSSSSSSVSSSSSSVSSSSSSA